MFDVNYTCVGCLITWYSREGLPPITVCPVCGGRVFDKQQVDFGQLPDERRVERLKEFMEKYKNS